MVGLKAVGTVPDRIEMRVQIWKTRGGGICAILYSATMHDQQETQYMYPFEPFTEYDSTSSPRKDAPRTGSSHLRNRVCPSELDDTGGGGVLDLELGTDHEPLGAHEAGHVDSAYDVCKNPSQQEDEHFSLNGRLTEAKRQSDGIPSHTDHF